MTIPHVGSRTVHTAWVLHGFRMVLCLCRAPRCLLYLHTVYIPLPGSNDNKHKCSISCDLALFQCNTCIALRITVSKTPSHLIVEMMSALYSV